jgi:hypothetical protein
MSDEMNQVQESVVIPSTLLADLLPEDLRMDPSLQDIRDVEQLAKNYRETKKFVGNSVRIPTEEASAEDRKAFLNKLSGLSEVIIKPSSDDADGMKAFKAKLGIPDTEDGYSYSFDEGTDLVVDTDFIKSFNKFALENQLTKAQADKMLKTEIANAQEAKANMAKNATEYSAKLKEMWGQAYEDKVAKANTALTLMQAKMAPEIQALADAGVLNNPAVLMMLADIGALTSEKSAAGVSFKSTTNTPADAEALIADIRGNRNHPYHLQYHPDHERAVQYMSKLYDQATNQAKG